MKKHLQIEISRSEITDFIAIIFRIVTSCFVETARSKFTWQLSVFTEFAGSRLKLMFGIQ